MGRSGYLLLNLVVMVGLLVALLVRPQVPEATEITDLKVLTQYPYGIILEASLNLAGDPQDIFWVNSVVYDQGEKLGRVTASNGALPRGTHTIRILAKIAICNPTEFDSDEIGIQLARNRKSEPYTKRIPFKKRWSNMISPKLITPCSSPPPPPPAPPPTLSAVFPTPVAAGHGQMVTIHGKHLTPTRLNRVTLQSKDDPSRSPFTCSFVFRGASTPQSLYVRLVAGYKATPPPDCPNGLHPSPGLYTLTVTTATGTSNGVRIEISAKPATPVIRYLKLYRGTGAPKEGEWFRAKVGSKMVVVAYGIDTAGIIARFEQGTKQVPVRSKMGVSPSSWGMGAAFTIPEVLVPGEAQVRIRTHVGSERSQWSRPRRFQIIP